jgi:hypothetical protein
MQQFTKWTLETIRSEGAMLSWLEESRFEWTATVSLAVKQIVSGKTIVLITDADRKWFAHYITAALNRPSKERPMIPIIRLEQMYPNFENIASIEMFDMLDDMLTLSFKGEYLFWYIGRGDDRHSDIAKRNDNSLLWIMDEDFQNAIRLHSYDPLIDIKLLQLYRLFDTTLNAVLFDEVDAAL